MGFLFSPFGRVSLGQFWLLFLLPLLAVQIAAAIGDTIFFDMRVNAQTGLPQSGPLSIMVGLFYFWPSIAVPVKRYHDHGMTGWWIIGAALVAAVAIVSGAFAFAPQILNMGEGSPLAFLIFIPSVLATIWLHGLIYVWPGQRSGNVHGPGPAHIDEVRAFEEDIMSQAEAQPVYRPSDPVRFNQETPARVGPRVSFGQKN